MIPDTEASQESVEACDLTYGLQLLTSLGTIAKREEAPVQTPDSLCNINHKDLIDNQAWFMKAHAFACEYACHVRHKLQHNSYDNDCAHWEKHTNYVRSGPSRRRRQSVCC